MEVDEECHNRASTQGRGGSSKDDEDEEAAIAVKRIPAVTLHIWGRILRPRGFELQHGKLVRGPPTLHVPAAQSCIEPQDCLTKTNGDSDAFADELVVPPQAHSALASFRRSHAFASQLKEPSHLLQSRRASTPLELNGPRNPQVTSEGTPVPPANIANTVTAETVSSEPSQRATRQGLFDGLTFRVLGEARCARVRNALAEVGGKVLGEVSDEPVDFIIVRLVR